MFNAPPAPAGRITPQLPLRQIVHRAEDNPAAALQITAQIGPIKDKF
jgi:hypothetical protein